MCQHFNSYRLREFSVLVYSCLLKTLI